MADPDLVVRLLAAIDEVEKLATGASHHHFAAMWARRTGRQNLHAYLAQVAEPAAVLRLCQALRDIVAMYTAYEEATRRFNEKLDMDCRPAEHEVQANRVDVEIYSQLSAVVRVLARGYGVEDGEGQRG